MVQAGKCGHSYRISLFSSDCTKVNQGPGLLMDEGWSWRVQGAVVQGAPKSHSSWAPEPGSASPAFGPLTVLLLPDVLQTLVKHQWRGRLHCDPTELVP